MSEEDEGASEHVRVRCHGCVEQMHPCMNDPDDPCFCPPIGPQRKRTVVRYSARFVEQVRHLGIDKRFPLRAVEREQRPPP